MCWHGSLDNTRRTVEKIIADRAKGILVITGIGSTPCPLEGLKSTLDSITLNEMSFGSEEELFIDAKGVSMPSPGQAWGTKAFLVDGAQAQPTGDEAFIRRVEAVPMKVMFEPKEGTDQPIDGIDVLSHAEMDYVVNYMRMGMHDRVAAKKSWAMVTSPHWWDDKMLVTGKYEKDEFVARVMDHIADPPTWDFPRMGADSDSHYPRPQISEDHRWEKLPTKMKTAYRTRRSQNRTQKRPIPQCGRLYLYRSKRLKRPRRTRRSPS